MTCVDVVSELHSLGGTIELISVKWACCFSKNSHRLHGPGDIKCNRPGSRYLNVPIYHRLATALMAF